MKTLNLDALAQANKTITLGGVEHAVVEMTVENFIATTKEAQALGDNPVFIDQIESTIKMISRSAPTISVETLRKLSLEQLMTLVKFIRGDMDGVATEAAEEKDATPGK